MYGVDTQVCIAMDFQVSPANTEQIIVYFDVSYTVQQLWALLTSEKTDTYKRLFALCGDTLRLSPRDAYDHHAVMQQNAVIAEANCFNFYVATNQKQPALLPVPSSSFALRLDEDSASHGTPDTPDDGLSLSPLSPSPSSEDLNINKELPHSYCCMIM